jgi:hypothetical protein
MEGRRNPIVHDKTDLPVSFEYSSPIIDQGRRNKGGVESGRIFVLR